MSMQKTSPIRNYARNAKGLALKRLQTSVKYDCFDAPLKSPPARLRRLGVRQADDQKSTSTNDTPTESMEQHPDKTLELLKQLANDSQYGMISPSKRQLKRFLDSADTGGTSHKQEGEDTTYGNQLNPLGRYHALSCEKCEKIFLSYHGYDTHLETHDGSAIRCWECDLRFKSNKSLVQHKRLRHSKTRSEDEMVGQGFHNIIFVDFSCMKFPEISQKYCEKYAIQAASHINDYSCKPCQKSFPIDTALALHNQQSHYTPSKFICNQCNHDYASKSLLEKHKQTYSTSMKKHLSDNKRAYIRALALMPTCLYQSMEVCKKVPATNYLYHQKLKDITSVILEVYESEQMCSDEDDSESTQS